MSLRDKPIVLEEIVRNGVAERPLLGSMSLEAHLLFLSPRLKEGVLPRT